MARRAMWVLALAVGAAGCGGPDEGRPNPALAIPRSATSDEAAANRGKDGRGGVPAKGAEKKKGP